MKARRHYSVTMSRSGAMWIGQVDAIKECSARGRTINQLTERLRAALEPFLGTAAQEVDLLPAVELPDPIKGAVEAAVFGRIEVEELQAKVAIRTYTAAKRLTDFGISLRDTGTLLGVSGQRIGKLMQEHEER